MNVLAVPPVLADPTGAVDYSVFAQYGLLGVVAALLLWFAKGAVQRERDGADRERARGDRLEEENRRLNTVIQDRIIPALTSAARAAEESTELLRAIQRERELDQRLRAKGGDL